MMTTEKMWEMAEKMEKELRENNVFASVYVDHHKIQVEIEWGDWKHDHGRAKWFISEHYKELMFYGTHVTEQDGSDTYSAIHSYMPTAW